MAYQAKSYGKLYRNLYHLVPLYKRAKKDVGNCQAVALRLAIDRNEGDRKGPHATSLPLPPLRG